MPPSSEVDPLRKDPAFTGLGYQARDCGSARLNDHVLRRKALASTVNAGVGWRRLG